MLIAAVAVSTGATTGDPMATAFANSAVQLLELAAPLATHAERTSASVFISACGTIPFVAGVYAYATPAGSEEIFAAFANAVAIPAAAPAVPELDTCVASVANPASAYAAATVDTSFTHTYGSAFTLPVLGQAPTAAIKVAAGLLPPLSDPPSAYTYTCEPEVQIAPAGHVKPPFAPVNRYAPSASECPVAAAFNTDSEGCP